MIKYPMKLSHRLWDDCGVLCLGSFPNLRFRESKQLEREIDLKEQ